MPKIKSSLWKITWMKDWAEWINEVNLSDSRTVEEEWSFLFLYSPALNLFCRRSFINNDSYDSSCPVGVINSSFPFSPHCVTHSSSTKLHFPGHGEASAAISESFTRTQSRKQRWAGTWTQHGVWGEEEENSQVWGEGTSTTAAINVSVTPHTHTGCDV